MKKTMMVRIPLTLWQQLKKAAEKERLSIGELIANKFGYKRRPETWVKP